MRRTSSKFGMSDAAWEGAKDQLRQAIIEAARDRRMTSYSEIAPRVTTVHVEPHSALMNHLLSAILEDESGSGRPLLTAIVTHKNGDLEPGAGFYDAAKALGHSVHEPLAFWSSQVTAVFKTYGRPARTDA